MSAITSRIPRIPSPLNPGSSRPIPRSEPIPLTGQRGFLPSSGGAFRSSPISLRHSLFNRDLLRRLETSWNGGSSGDPWPGIPPVRTAWDWVVSGVSAFFSPTIPAPGPVSAASIPSVEEVLSYHRSFEKVEGAERETLWRESLERLREEGFTDFPAGMTYDSFRARLQSLGPRLRDRVVSLRSALTLIQNHERLGAASDDRPVAVVIGPASDYNNAFTSFSGYPVLDTLIDSGRFNILYFEAADESTAHDALLMARHETGHRLHTAVFGGHGLRTALALGGDDPGNGGAAGPETDFLDIGDLASGEFSDLDEIMEPEGQILMWSCSNGEGGVDTLNMANGMAELAPGRSVFSTPIPSNILRLAVRDDLSLDLEWRETEGYIAIHSPADPSILHPESDATAEAVQIAGLGGRHRNSVN